MKRLINGSWVLMLFCLFSPALPQPTPVWQTIFEKEVRWHQLAPTGHLMVSTKSALFGVNPATGEILWQRPDLRDLRIWPEKEFVSWVQEFVPFSPYAVVRKFSGANKTFKHSGQPYYITLVNAVTGEDLWTTETMGFREHNGYFFLPEIGGMFIYAKDRNKRKTAILVELNTGEVIWERQEFFKNREPEKFGLFLVKKGTPGDPFFGEDETSKKTIAGNQPPAFDTENTMILFMNKTVLQKFSLDSGEMVWETEVNARKPPAVRNGYGYMLLDDDSDILYTPCDKTVYALRTWDGSLVWSKTPKLNGAVTQMMLTQHGLVVKGEPATPDGMISVPFLTLIDLETGIILWEKTYRSWFGSSNFVIKDDKLVLFANNALMSVDLANGASTLIIDNLQFLERAQQRLPNYLKMRTDGYFLQSLNNIMLVSFMGEKRFHTYFHPPSGLGGSEESMAKVERALNVVVNLLGYPGGPVPDVARLRWKWLREYITDKRFQASLELEKYAYMLSEINSDTEKSVGLFQVDKMTGDTVDQITLGTRTPEYQLDEFDARLFLKTKKKQIACYRFPMTQKELK